MAREGAKVAGEVAELAAADDAWAVRLREVPWPGLRGLQPVVLPAIAAVLEGAAAERVIDRLLRGRRDLAPAQRTAVVEAIFGVALWRRRLAWHAEPLPDRAAPLPNRAAPLPDRAAPLLFSLLRDLAGVPEELAAELSGLDGPRPPLRDPPGPIALRWSFPDWIADTFARDFGAEASALCAALNAPGPICLRANALKTTRDELAALLAGEGVRTRPGRWSPLALIVEGGRPNIYGLRAHQQGLFEVQDEGSQLLGLLVGARPGETILDLCAGAGGKTLLLAGELAARGPASAASASSAASALHAHDVDGERLGRLRLRADRAGVRGLQLHHGVLPDALRCDAVLIDAPCSELGSLRRGPDLRFRLSPDQACAFPPLQLRLLEQAARHLRPGGRLVYATCTLRREENEEVVAAFLTAHRSFRLRPTAPAGVPARMIRAGLFKSLPHLHGTDGFFAAVLDSA